MSNRIKVAMVSLGCSKNQVDAEQMMAKIADRGYAFVAEPGMADIVLVNTCGFIQSAKEEAIGWIMELIDLKNEGRIKRIIVTGCLSERYREQFAEEFPEIDAVVGIAEYGKIADIVDGLADFAKPAHEEGTPAVCYFGKKESHSMEGKRIISTLPHYAYLRIADGCDNCCTYCAIPSIRGKMRSRTIEDCVSEAQRLADEGVTELTVVAQDTTAYGTDIYGKPMLCELLKRLCKIDGLHWIRTLYTYPERITDELLETVAGEEKLVKYFDIPIQHANGEILRRMNRRGNYESLSALIDRIREKIPGVTLRTTLITGFPGETEEQFCELDRFVQEKRFDRLGCFTYSAEENTIAANMPDQIDEQVKTDRMEHIMEHQLTVSGEINAARIGTETEVLIEGWDDYIKCYFGRTPAEAPEVDGKIFFLSDRPLVIGQYVRVRINDTLDYDLLGELIADEN